MNISGALLSVPVRGKGFWTAFCTKLSTGGKSVFFECSWQKSLIIFGISLGERYGCIFVFQSIRRSRTHCYKLQAPGLWKSRRSPTTSNRIMSTVLQVARRQVAHRCHPVMNSSGWTLVTGISEPPCIRVILGGGGAGIVKPNPAEPTSWKVETRLSSPTGGSSSPLHRWNFQMHVLNLDL